MAPGARYAPSAMIAKGLLHYEVVKSPRSSTIDTLFELRDPAGRAAPPHHSGRDHTPYIAKGQTAANVAGLAGRDITRSRDLCARRTGAGRSRRWARRDAGQAPLRRRRRRISYSCTIA